MFLESRNAFYRAPEMLLSPKGAFYSSPEVSSRSILRCMRSKSMVLSPDLFPQKEVRTGSSEHRNASHAARGALHATSRTHPAVFLESRNAFYTSPEVLLNPKGAF